MPTEMELTLEQTQQGVSYEVSVAFEGVDPHGFEVKEVQRSFRHSDTERLSRSDEVLKLKNFKKDATLKLSKSSNQECSRNKLNPEVNDHYNIFSRESQEYELKTKDEANRSRIGINKWYQSFSLRNFDLEDMEFETTHSNTSAKLPILKLVTKMSVPITAEEKTNKKNDVKARSLLLMALPNEHQLTFS
ncbi:hypothetical protein Tco_1194188 [Tanacetum coccineum]